MKKVIVTAIVVLFATVAFGQVKTNIKPEKLPVCAIEWGKVNMNGYTAETVQKVEFKPPDKVATYYYVKYVKGKEHQWVQYSSDCSTAKKVPDGELKSQVQKTKAPEVQKQAVPGKENPSSGKESK